MSQNWKVWLSRTALVLGILGTFSLYYSLEIGPSTLTISKGKEYTMIEALELRKLPGKPIAVVLAERIKFRTLGWGFLGLGFFIQLVLTFDVKTKKRL